MRKIKIPFPAFFKSRPIRGVAVFFALCATAAAIGAAYYPARRYSREVISEQSKTCSVSIELTHQPAWITKDLSALILEQASIFSQVSSLDPVTGKTVKNFARMQNPIDAGILGELADAFTLHPAEHNNAWIKRIVAIHRTFDRKANQQKITIDAEYRQSVALVARGDFYYQVDAEGVRLPGELSVQDCLAVQARSPWQLLVIRGADCALPEPGQAFDATDFSAALQLAEILSQQPYARQIAAIDVNNFGGRVDKSAPQITLDTAFGTQIWWGRAPHDEMFYEVSLPAKLSTLSSIALRYSRIDASQRYVDIRFEQPRIPAPEIAKAS
jgi:hypothetical protein